jgi:1-acyl-sn-glycerol-3-phosphate acyltransferase
MMKLIYFLRSLFHALWMVVTLTPWALLMLLASIFCSGSVVWKMAQLWLRQAMWALGWIVGMKVRVTGMENLPQGKTSRAILLAKHQSVLETFLLPILMPNQLAFVFKKELLYVPVFGWGLASMDMIHIDRSLGDKAFAKVVEQGKKYLGRGVWVIMYPEGTRAPRGERMHYKTGGTRLAVETGAPVVPIACATARVWPRKSLTKYPGTVEISIGKPIPSAGRDPIELMKEVEDWIEAEMRRIDPDACAGEAHVA